jgi:hypothetical protein
VRTSRERRPAPARIHPALGLALLLAFLLPPAQAAAAMATGATPYDTGQRIQVSGVVTDAQGKPLENVRVMLEVSRSYFSLRQLQRTAKEPRRVATTTNARGEYALEWAWDSYFNTFEILVGVPVRRGKGERIEVVERVDVTQRLLGGSPVTAAVVVKDAGRIARLRGFPSTLKSEDERRVYGEMGSPDEVRVVDYPDHREATWWYFKSGRAYRFEDGRLAQVVPFEPVASF